MLPSRPHQDLQRNTLQALRRTHGCRKWLKLDLRRTHDAIATPFLQAPTACRRTFGQDPLFQVPASVSGMGMPVPTSPSRQGCRPFSREFSTTLPPGGGHTETHYRGWVCVTKKGSPPKPPGSAPSGPRWPKMAQDGPRWVQDAFKMAQDGPKMALRWPKMACLAPLLSYLGSNLLPS